MDTSLNHPTLRSVRLKVEGRVQGVGFRPAVFRLAQELALAGCVFNSSEGATIDIEGPAAQVGRFLEAFPEKLPPQAEIVKVDLAECAPRGFSSFHIIESESSHSVRAHISPDLAACTACRSEVQNPANRRFLYPFTNCTDCGPRFTIVTAIPYDRIHTTMQDFTQCDDCQREYNDPSNRRFHAEPNACPVCGPRIQLIAGLENPAYPNRECFTVDRRDIPVPHPSGDPIQQAAMLLREGRILAVKGLGGYHLACDATNAQTVKRLRERKRRDEKPFAVMAADVAAAERFCTLTPEEKSLLESVARPIVLLRKKETSEIVEDVAPRNRFLGILLPYAPLHHMLLRAVERPLVMTSGNWSEEPIAFENKEAEARLGTIADFFLHHNRRIFTRCDDSVVRVAAGVPRLIRRSRGYVPQPVLLDRPVSKTVLACGGELKNTFCFLKDNQAILSHHIGDLENLETLRSFELAVQHFQGLLECQPQVLAADRHPRYLSTQYAVERAQQESLPLVLVQHHHAHLASAMAEHGLRGHVIGIIWDGTGFGLDEKLWGSEFLVGDERSFRRIAHLEYAPMPSAEQAIREPWRMALGWLYAAFGRDLVRWIPEPLRSIEQRKIEAMILLMENRINAPETCGMGRLFDGLAALTGVRQLVRFEGQAAMELEMIQKESGCGAYSLEWSKTETGWKIGVRPLLEAIVNDLARGVSPSEISAQFHQALIDLAREGAERIRAQWNLHRVVLSGGVFQNVTLLEGIIAQLERAGFEVFTHSQVPANDGGLALGQALVAAAKGKAV